MLSQGHKSAETGGFFQNKTLFTVWSLTLVLYQMTHGPVRVGSLCYWMELRPIRATDVVTSSEKESVCFGETTDWKWPVSDSFPADAKDDSNQQQTSLLTCCHPVKPRPRDDFSVRVTMNSDSTVDLRVIQWSSELWKETSSPAFRRKQHKHCFNVMKLRKTSPTKHVYSVKPVKLSD